MILKSCMPLPLNLFLNSPSLQSHHHSGQVADELCVPVSCSTFSSQSVDYLPTLLLPLDSTQISWALRSQKRLVQEIYALICLSTCRLAESHFPLSFGATIASHNPSHQFHSHCGMTLNLVCLAFLVILDFFHPSWASLSHLDLAVPFWLAADAAAVFLFSAT